MIFLLSGETMKRLTEYLADDFKIKPISTATLLVKPSSLNIPFYIYFVYEVKSDNLLVGYGFPWKNLDNKYSVYIKGHKIGLSS